MLSEDIVFVRLSVSVHTEANNITIRQHFCSLVNMCYSESTSSSRKSILETGWNLRNLPDKSLISPLILQVRVKSLTSDAPLTLFGFKTKQNIWKSKNMLEMPIIGLCPSQISSSSIRSSLRSRVHKSPPPISG